MADEKRPPARPRYLDGKALRRKRLAAGLDQARLAELAGANRANVSHYENGDFGCNIGMLHKFAEALGCDPADLMLSDGDEPEPERLAS